jgi:hypothetical protein
MDGSLLEDVVAGGGTGAMNGDSPVVGISDVDNNYDDDICRRHLEGLSFWVRMLGSNIPGALLLDLFDISMAQRSLVSHYYSVERGWWHCRWQQQIRAWQTKHWRGGGRGRQRRVLLIGRRQEIGCKRQK